ncbi:MAG: hypothetical protein ACUZ8H_16050 [Candidatus Anammoxibacter sp.]
MLNVSKLYTGMYGIVGIRQPLNPDYAVIDSANQATSSGYYATDNEFVKVEYIKDGQDLESLTDPQFNAYLKDKQQESILNVGNMVFNNVDYIDRNLYYRYAQNKTDTITLPIGFVGYKLEIDSKKNVAISIKRVLLDFDLTGSIKLLLWNTGKKEVIESKVINITTDHQEEVLDWVIDNTDGTYKGDFYIGYNTTGVVPKPFARAYNNSSVPSVFTYLNITPLQITGHNTELLFDLTLEEGMSDATGLNFDFTVYEDFTDQMINNKNLFANAIKMDFQISLLSISLASLRSNRNERMSEAMTGKILAEIEGADNGTIKKVGLRTLLTRNIGMIRKEIEKLQKGYVGLGIFTETLV